MTLERIIGGVLAAVGVLAVLLGLWLFLRARRRRRRGIVAHATVTGYEVRDDDGRPTYVAQLEFRSPDGFRVELAVPVAP